jgi:hypothetical protein
MGLERVWHAGLAWLRSSLLWTLRVIGTLAALGIFFWAAWWGLPQLMVAGAVADPANPNKAFELENSARATVGQTFVGLVALAGIWVAYKNAQAATRNAEAAARSANAAERNAEVAQDGRVTERFTRAIEQLASDKLESRLGGVYALERIARDSPLKDHQTIMEVLCAFIHDRATWQAVELVDTPPADNVMKPNDEGPYLLPYVQHPPPPTDIQAALTVLGRRRTISEQMPLNLTRTDLRGADLMGAYLADAHLMQSQLDQAKLVEANLQGARLMDASLRRTYLIAAHLEGAICWTAHLEEAILMDTDLRGADLREAFLHGAVLRNAHLEGTDLTDSVGLTQQQIDEIGSWDEATRLPPGLIPPANRERPIPMTAAS